MKTLLVLFLTALAALAQSTPKQSVSITGYPQSDKAVLFIENDSAGNALYVCTGEPIQPPFFWTRALTTLTSIVVSSNTATVTTSTAHGLQVANQVTVLGATVDPDLNGTYYVQTVGSTTTFTITTASVSNATYNEATLAVSTTAPRLTAAIWTIQHFLYDSNTHLSTTQWAEGQPGNYTHICANRGVTTGATKVTYQ